MKTSQRGIDLIKSFEGLSLRAVQLQGEQYYTIGYGHYGEDVGPNRVITRDEAEALLRQDLQQFEAWVTRNCKSYAKFEPNQNQFDALVSFCYNCGQGSLKQLVNGRTASQVAAHMLAYTKSGSPDYTQGLLNRRTKERALFLTPVEEEDTMARWQKLEDIPAGSLRETARRYVEKGVLAGGSGGLNVTEDMLRTLIMAERLDAQADNPILSLVNRIRELEKENQDLRDEINVLYSDVRTEQLKQGGGA